MALAYRVPLRQVKGGAAGARPFPKVTRLVRRESTAGCLRRLASAGSASRDSLHRHAPVAHAGRTGTLDLGRLSDDDLRWRMCLASRPHSAARSASSPSGRSPCARRGRPASARAASIGWRCSRRGQAGRTSRRGARCLWPTRLASELDRWSQRTLLSDDDDLVFARPQTANPWAPPKTAGSSQLHLQGLDDFDAPGRDFPGSAVPEGAAGARCRPHSWRRDDRASRR